MAKLASSILEMIRMMIIMMIFVMILSNIEQQILEQWISWEGMYYFFLFIGNVLWFAVLYRNRLQFSGWYRSKMQEKLSRKSTWILMSLGTIFIAAPVMNKMFGFVAGL